MEVLEVLLTYTHPHCLLPILYTSTIFRVYRISIPYLCPILYRVQMYVHAIGDLSIGRVKRPANFKLVVTQLTVIALKRIYE
jgi:hypothetical protein